MSIFIKQSSGIAHLNQPYVIGQSTYWIYRKWYDGYVELWNKYYEFSYTTSSQSGNLYFMSKDNWGTDLTDISLTSVVGLYATINSKAGEGLTFPCTQSIQISNGQLIMTLYVCSPVQVRTARHIEVMCYALCKWK